MSDLIIFSVVLFDANGRFDLLADCSFVVQLGGITSLWRVPAYRAMEVGVMVFWLLNKLALPAWPKIGVTNVPDESRNNVGIEWLRVRRARSAR